MELYSDLHDYHWLIFFVLTRVIGILEEKHALSVCFSVGFYSL